MQDYFTKMVAEMPTSNIHLNQHPDQQHTGVHSHEWTRWVCGNLSPNNSYNFPGPSSSKNWADPWRKISLELGTTKMTKARLVTRSINNKDDTKWWARSCIQEQQETELPHRPQVCPGEMIKYRTEEKLPAAHGQSPLRNTILKGEASKPSPLSLNRAPDCGKLRRGSSGPLKLSSAFRALPIISPN